MTSVYDYKYTEDQVILFVMNYMPTSLVWLNNQLGHNNPDKVLSRIIKHFQHDYLCQECMRIAFNTRLEDMPLYVEGHPENHSSVIPSVAKWRLRIGR